MDRSLYWFIMKSQSVLFVLSCVLTLTSCNHDNRPNIVIMIADDLGIGDIGCFGNTTLRTPHIDSIAAEGVKLTHHLTASSVCTPSRAALMTGRYPIRMGLVESRVVPVTLFTSSLSGMPADEVTFAELAKTQGYSTAFIGKWHLGLHSQPFTKDFAQHPLNQGFDYFYGLPLTNLKDFGDDGDMIIVHHNPNFYRRQILLLLAVTLAYIILKRFLGGKMASTVAVILFIMWLVYYLALTNLKILSSILLRNHDVIEQPIKLPGFTDRLINEGTNFLQQRKQDQQPFLLIMSWIQVHTALHATHFRGKSAHGPYGDEVEELDWSVGQILSQLQSLGFKNNTLVYFTSDNGGHTEEVGLHGNREGGYNGLYRGGKFQGGMDGGIRVPTVAMWPGVIPPGSQIDRPSSLMDMYPTIADAIGTSMPSDRIIDGKNLMPLLAGQTKQIVSHHDFMFHYCGTEIHSARYIPKQGGSTVWKAYFMTPNWLPGTQSCSFHCNCYDDHVTKHDPPLLYNIGLDPSEYHQCTADKPCLPLTSTQQHNDVINTIRQAVAEHIKTVDTEVKEQLTYLNIIPRPWLQICCNFPSCSCSEF